MNKFALLPLFLFLFSGLNAQDRIISINHDTIYCSIISINNERIMYEVKNSDGSVNGGFMNLSKVAEYTRSPQTEINSKQAKLKSSKNKNIVENQWYLGLNIGGSTLPWYFDNIESTSEMPDYYNKLKSGFHISTSAHYMINGFMGVGAEYSFFNTNFSGSMPTEYNVSTFLMITEKYREYMNYLGPSVLFVQHPDAKRKFTFTESLSGGLLFFRLENQNTYSAINYSSYTDVTSNSLITGNSLSAKLGLSALYSLSRHVSVGFGGDFIWGSLKKADYETRGPNDNSSSEQNQELPNALILSRIDYSLVLRFRF